MTTNGKWSQPGVPHKGWVCVDVEDLGRPDAVCEMCEVIEIRYVHKMEHPDYPNELSVGCVCAEHMEDDYVGPREREKRLRDRARRQRTWHRRQWWRASLSSDSWYLNTEGFHLTVYPTYSGWQVQVKRHDGKPQRGRGCYPTRDAAIAKALDALLWAKDNL